MNLQNVRAHVGSWAMIFLGLWLMLTGAAIALNLTFNFYRFISGGLLIAGGLCLMLGK